MNKKSASAILFWSISMALPAQIAKSWDFENIANSTGRVHNIALEQGVAGNAALFNGYTSEWEEAGITAIPKTLFIEAWVAPLEYSFNVSAIVNQQNGNDRGFLLGINQNGQLVASFYTEGKQQICISDEFIPILKWSHVACAYQEGKGLQLFINGMPIKSLSFTEKPTVCPECPLVIGKNQKKDLPAFTEQKKGKKEIEMRFNGLIDELKISEVIPDAEELQQQVKRIGKVGVQALQPQQMPSVDIPQGAFGAYYTRLRYSPGWEALWRVGDYPDVVVRFPDSPVKYVFWRGTGYIPAIVSENNIWMSDQSLETYGAEGCYEAMGDKQCRYSHVRILESTPARCVIHWRYALSSINHSIMHEDETGWGDWADEYWTIYPDGVGIRKQVLHSDYYKKDKGYNYQFQETILFNQPGTKPQDNLEMEAIQFSDMDGHIASYSWEQGVPKAFEQPTSQPIQIVNIKAKYKPFSIFRSDRITLPFNFGWMEGYSSFPCWNHWPVSQIKSDGRNATMPDKPSHTSLTREDYDMQVLEAGPDNTYIARQMTGTTTEPIQTLLPLARSWNNPPAVKITTKGYKNKGYNQYQRAYLIESDATIKNNETLQFTVQASEAEPVHNMAFVIENWNHRHIKVSIDGKSLTSGKGFESGFIQTLESSQMVLWVPVKSNRPVSVTIKAIK